MWPSAPGGVAVSHVDMNQFTYITLRYGGGVVCNSVNAAKGVWERLEMCISDLF